MQKMQRAGGNNPDAVLKQDNVGAGQAQADKPSNFDYEPYRGYMMNALTQAMMHPNFGEKFNWLTEAGIKLFKGKHPDVPQMPNYTYFAQSTLWRMLERQSLGDAARPGAARQLSEENVDKAIELFLAGNGNEGDEWWGYTSIGHAVADNEEIAAILVEDGVSVQTLWRRMQMRSIETEGKPLKKINIKLKPVLKEDVKQERVDAANLWLEWGLEKLKNVVWIDEKQEYLSPGGTYRCYAPRKMKSFQRADLNDFSSKDRIKYEAAVNARLGPIYLSFITGTTGMPKRFKVRTIVPAPADPHATLSAAQCPSLVYAIQLAAGIFAANAQYVETKLCCKLADPLVALNLLCVCAITSAQVLFTIPVDQQAVLVCVRRSCRMLLCEQQYVDTCLEQVCAYKWLDLMHQRWHKTLCCITTANAMLQDVCCQLLLFL